MQKKIHANLGKTGESNILQIKTGKITTSTRIVANIKLCFLRFL